MSGRPLIVASLLLFSICASSAQTPSPDAMTAARTLVTTMKLPEQYKALLPAILLGLRRTLTQDRPEIESDYDSMKPMVDAAFTPYYTAMLDDVAAIYANNYTVAEMRDMEAFFQRPVGQEYAVFSASASLTESCCSSVLRSASEAAFSFSRVSAPIACARERAAASSFS